MLATTLSLVLLSVKANAKTLGHNKNHDINFHHQGTSKTSKDLISSTALKHDHLWHSQHSVHEHAVQYEHVHPPAHSNLGLVQGKSQNLPTLQSSKLQIRNWEQDLIKDDDDRLKAKATSHPTVQKRLPSIVLARKDREVAERKSRADLLMEEASRAEAAVESSKKAEARAERRYAEAQQKAEVAQSRAQTAGNDAKRLYEEEQLEANKTEAAYRHAEALSVKWRKSRQQYHASRTAASMLVQEWQERSNDVREAGERAKQLKSEVQMFAKKEQELEQELNSMGLTSPTQHATNQVVSPQRLLARLAAITAAPPGMARVTSGQKEAAGSSQATMVNSSPNSPPSLFGMLSNQISAAFGNLGKLMRSTWDSASPLLPLG